MRATFTMFRCMGWGLLLVGCAMWAGRASAQEKGTAAQPQLLYLHTEYLPYKAEQPDMLPYRLGREIMRQAVLVAARDELGCVTCDETLMEAVPTQANVLHLLVTERAKTTGKWQVKLTKSDKGDTVWEKTFDFLAHGGKIYADFIPKIEAETRSTLVEALRTAGVKGTKPARKAPMPPGPEIEQALNAVDIVAQFGAVRAAHAAIAREGETPEWLGVLVRGYANLAMLTRHYWYSAPEVYTARAWLYAQRMVAADPQSELALWHRAYAWSLGGAQQHALADLADLEQRRAAAGSNAVSLPPWTNLLKVYLTADLAGLDQVGKDQIANRAWSLVLKFHLASCYYEDYLLFNTAREIDQVCPTAYSTYGYLITRGQHLRLSRIGAAWGPKRFAELAPRSLAKLPDLPASVQSVVVKIGADEEESEPVEDEGDEEGLARPFSSLTMVAAERLRGESSKVQGEPSWSALGSMLEEEQFLLVVQYFIDSGNATERDLSADTAALLPLIQRHRYAALIETQRISRNRDFAELTRLFSTVKITDPRMNMMPMFLAFWGVPNATGESLGWPIVARAQRNFTIQGMMEYVIGFSENPDIGTAETRAMLVNELREVAPQWDCTYIFGLDWLEDPTPEKLKQIESALKFSPLAWSRLAKQYYGIGDIDGATRCAQRALDVAPIADPTLLLANIYQRQNEMEKWEQTLTKFLEAPDLGLMHGPVLQTLANGLAARGQWRRAKPFALQHSQSYQALGLAMAGYICEGLAEWEESEEWFQALSTSYPSSSGFSWYFWCRRTGRGQADTAKQLAEHWFAANPLGNREVAISSGVFHEVNGDPAAALDAYQAALTFRPSFNVSFKVARLARQTGDERLRTETLNTAQKVHLQTTEEQPPEERKVIAAGLAILQLMKTGDASADRLAKIEKLLMEVDGGSRAAYCGDLAMELDALGKKEDAERYLRRCLVNPDGNWAHTTLAGFELAKRHKTSRPDDDVLDESDLWPPLSAPADQPAPKQ